jgi:hypothetical protein
LPCFGFRRKRFGLPGKYLRATPSFGILTEANQQSVTVRPAIMAAYFEARGQVLL